MKIQMTLTKSLIITLLACSYGLGSVVAALDLHRLF